MDSNDLPFGGFDFQMDDDMGGFVSANLGDIMDELLAEDAGLAETYNNALVQESVWPEQAEVVYDGLGPVGDWQPTILKWGTSSTAYDFRGPHVPGGANPNVIENDPFSNDDIFEPDVDNMPNILDGDNYIDAISFEPGELMSTPFMPNEPTTLSSVTGVGATAASAPAAD